MRGISWLAEYLLTFQEGLSSTKKESISTIVIIYYYGINLYLLFNQFW
jgi:hypothetical protein